MKQIACVVLALCLACGAAEAQEITSRASVGLALTSADETLLTGANPPPRRQILTTDKGVQGAYAIEFTFAGDAALQVGLAALHVPTHLRADSVASSRRHDDGLNLAILTLGVAYHIPVRRWDVHITPFAAATAPATLVFDDDERSTSLTVPERWTWGVEAGAARELGRSPFSIDFFIRYTDLRLRMTDGANGRHDLRPLVLGVGLVYRH